MVNFMPQDGAKTSPRSRGGPSSVVSFYLPQDIGGEAYFELPFSVMGNNIKSYGGYLSYILNFRGRGSGPSNAPDIIVIVSIQILTKNKGFLNFSTTFIIFF